MSDTEIPDDLRYSEEDEWLRDEEDHCFIGITDYAQQQLGDIVFVELPEVGSDVKKGQPFGVIESVKAVSDLYAPVSGEVIEVNQALVSQPELVNSDCYGDGWIVSIAPSNEAEIGQLLDAAAYARHITDRNS